VAQIYHATRLAALIVGPRRARGDRARAAIARTADRDLETRSRALRRRRRASPSGTASCEIKVDHLLQCPPHVIFDRAPIVWLRRLLGGR
jgi:hypothetical protein